MSLLRVLHLPLVPARLGRHRLGSVEVARLVARRGQRRLRQGRRVGAHVGDVAVLVEALGDAHRLLRREAQLPARLLLQRRGHERRRRTARVRLLVDRRDPELGALERGREAACVVLDQLHDVLGLQRAVAPEVAALCDPRTVDRREPRSEGPGIECRDDVPVAGGDELPALPFALDDEPRRDRLHAPGRQSLHHLPPEHRGDLVAVEAVEDAAGFLRIDEARVDVARLGERALDRRARDLVEDHAADRHLRLQLLHEMPGDRLAFAVFVRREQQLIGVLQLRLQVGDDLPLARVDDVDRLELAVDVDAEPGPLLVLVLRGYLGGVLRQVADVADRRLDDKVGAEVAGDRLRLGRRLDDHEPLSLGCGHFARHLSALAQIRDTRRR